MDPYTHIKKKKNPNNNNKQANAINIPFDSKYHITLSIQTDKPDQTDWKQSKKKKKKKKNAIERCLDFTLSATNQESLDPATGSKMGLFDYAFKGIYDKEIRCLKI